MTDTKQCPNCGNPECHRDDVDVGVGIIYGPWGCPQCGWSEHPDYDRSKGQDPMDEKGGVKDQYGGYHPPGSSMAVAHKLAEEDATVLDEFRRRFKRGKD